LKSHFLVTDILIKYGADVNNKNKLEESPFLASGLGHIQCVELLLSANATILGNGKDPIISAVKERNFDIVKLLLSRVPSSCKNEELNDSKQSQGFEIYLTQYVLENSSEIGEAADLISNILSYVESEVHKNCVHQVINCLVDLEWNKSYDNLLELCGVSYSEAVIYVI